MNSQSNAAHLSWSLYFQENAKRLLKVEPNAYQVTDEERERITRSIQQFQLGEASEGKLLRAKARKYAERCQDPAYEQSIDFLIKEENRHSAYLGAFMREQNIPRVKKAWTDSIFRLVRNLASLEVSIRVLVTAEIIALLYYRCLGGATKSPVLSNICARMLDEEEKHVRFQMFHIHRINFLRFPLFSAWMDIAHALLFYGTTLAVWKDHRAVLKTEFRSYSQFLRASVDRFKQAMDEGDEDAFDSLRRKS